MSMKSTTMIPPTSRRRSCFAISRAASRFVFRIVCSGSFLPFPVNLPVFTSIDTSASVGSITRWPPDLRRTARLKASWMPSSTPYLSKRGIEPSCRWTRSRSSGSTLLTYSTISLWAALESTRKASNLSLNRSRITPLISLASRCTAVGAFCERARFWILVHRSRSRVSSRSSFSCVTSSPTVRTMIPPLSSGRIRWAILRSLARCSRPSILRLTPTRDDWGM